MYHMLSLSSIFVTGLVRFPYGDCLLDLVLKALCFRFLC